MLFLAVQREDCLGDTDLYISFFDEKEKCFSEPKNLGPKINTSRIESAPFLAYDNRTLYFSSNRTGGLGGLDLYLTRRLDDSWLNWSEPINLGMRVNSNFDDKSIYLTALSDSALIVSSDSLELRHGIYYVCIPKELKPQPYTILCGNIYLNSVANPFKRQLNFSVTNKQTKEKFETVKRSAVYSGDILISKTGTLGLLGVLPTTVEKAMITSRLAKISIDNEKADVSFVFHWLRKLKLDGYWEKVSQGGTMQILGIRMLKEVPFPNITVKEQRAIALILSDMDNEIEKLEQQLKKYLDIKRGAMQTLLTGKVRLK